MKVNTSHISLSIVSKKKFDYFSSFFVKAAGFPPNSELLGTFFVIIEPVAIMELSPI
jgi:hypothetical protein